jgi:predicted RNA methylase
MVSRAVDRGAARVVGVDPDRERVEWARRNLASRYPDLAGRVILTVEDVGTVAGEFELVICKDTAEHIADLATTLAAVRARLTGDGQVWIGFSPLYHSPFGDHGRAGRLLRLPWLHTLPWPIVRRVASRHRAREVLTLDDLGLNGITPADFRHAVDTAGLKIESIAYNRGDRTMFVPMRLLRRVRPLERYLTVNIYAVLTRRGRP